MASESRKGRSIVSATFVVFVSIFIVSTTWQIGHGVFGRQQKSKSPPPPACVAGIARLAPALDRALAAASPIPGDAAKLDAYANTALPEWNDSQNVESVCAITPEGKAAFASLLRLRQAQESFLQRQVAELSPMRRDVEGYLR